VAVNGVCSRQEGMQTSEIVFPCEISGSCSGITEDLSLLGCDDMSCCVSGFWWFAGPSGISGNPNPATVLDPRKLESLVPYF